MNKKDIKPLYNSIVVELDEAVTKTKTGIALPDSVVKERTGTVLSVGPGLYNMSGLCNPVQVDAGDHVVFKKGASLYEYKTDEGEVHITTDEEVLAVIGKK